MTFDQPPGTHVAEINIGRTRGLIDEPVMKDFADRLEPVNALADRAPGFVWRLVGDGDHAMDVRVSDDPLEAINLSVWETPAALADFVWKTVHVKMYSRRHEWFETPTRPIFVMWWAPVGHIPSVDEALERLDSYRRDGPSPDAFGWSELPEARLWRERRCA